MDSTRTIEVKIYLDEAWHEYLIAELSDLEFESFVEHEDHLLAYVRARDWNDVARETIERWLLFHDLPVRVEETVYEPTNWNQKWEETVKPIVVDRFLIKPTWSDVPPEGEGRLLLEIDPKMSFGTGYHESTRLVLRLLPDYATPGARVLDAGTGTGVLAIAAARLGAASVLAFDIDPWAYTNALENVYINGVSEVVSIRAGSLDVANDGTYDLILANINRNVLIDMLPDLERLLDTQGYLILAGLLESDRDRMLRTAAHWGLRPVREATEGMWWAVVLEHEDA